MVQPDLLPDAPSPVVDGYSQLEESLARGESAGAGRMTRQCANADAALVRVLERLVMSRDPPDLTGHFASRIRSMWDVYAAPSLLARPSSFFAPPEPPLDISISKRRWLRSGRRLDISFPSAYRTFDPSYQATYDIFKENRTCHARFLTRGRPGAPVAVCIHYWFGGYFDLDEQVLAARTLFRRGLDVLLFTLPFHGRRTPRQATLSGQLFPSRDLQRTNEAFGQAVADLGALLHWLRVDRSAGPVGLVGMSLGGYTAALMAGLDPNLAFVIPVMAPSSFADVMWHHGEDRPGRLEAEEVGFSLWDFRTLWAVQCPLMHQPLLPPGRLHILWGEGDRVVPQAHQHALWHHWGQPEIHRYPGSHLVPLGRRGYVRAMTKWIEQRL